jgi:transcriptional regulator with XRE-family HTH domain
VPDVRKPKSPLAAWIVDQRKRLGWKSEELAARLDVAESTVRGWESGRSVSAESITRLERAFGVEAPGSHDSTGGDVAGAIREQAASNDRLAEAMQAQAEAFTTLAASIDRASTGVVGTVGGFDELLRGLLVALRAPASEAPASTRSAGPHARAER